VNEREPFDLAASHRESRRSLGVVVEAQVERRLRLAAETRDMLDDLRARIRARVEALALG
jgi:hypothetical protein